MRRQFSLPENDVLFLDSNGYKWETIVDGGHKWLLIHDYKVPKNYNREVVQLALRIDNGYPISQIDMVYFFPGLNRLDGKMIRALCPQNLDGKVFQRWSRHRTGENPWRSGLDDISVHLLLVDYWLEREFTLR